MKREEWTYDFVNWAFYTNFDKELVQIIKKSIGLMSQKEITVFDVGCYIGSFSDSLNRELRKNIDKKITYHLFDPNGRVKKSLSERLKFKYHYHQVAISDNNHAEQNFYFNPVNPWAMSSLDPSYLGNKFWRWSRAWAVGKRNIDIQVFKTKTITIDDFCYRNNVSTVDVLKIDVEGTQYEVILGAQKTLQSCSIVIVEVIATKKDFNEQFRKVENFLYSKNFVLHQQKKTSKVLEKLSSFKAKDLLFVKRNLLCLSFYGSFEICDYYSFFEICQFII